MADRSSPGVRLRTAVSEERPLQVVGTINAYTALLADRAGCKSIYLSGAGVANTSCGLPDLGITSLNDVCEDVRRITSATELPLLVDADTGWGAAFNISRTISDLVRSGAAGCHLEDQVQANAAVTARQGARDRSRNGRPSQAAVDGRTDHQFSDHGAHRRARRRPEAAIDRALAYVRRAQT
jgi:methylisocitrate lyase